MSWAGRCFSLKSVFFQRCVASEAGEEPGFRCVLLVGQAAAPAVGYGVGSRLGSRGEQPGCPHPCWWDGAAPAPLLDKSLQRCGSRPAWGSSQAPSRLGPYWLKQRNFLLSYDQSLIIAEE